MISIMLQQPPSLYVQKDTGRETNRTCTMQLLVSVLKIVICIIGDEIGPVSAGHFRMTVTNPTNIHKLILKLITKCHQGHRLKLKRFLESLLVPNIKQNKLRASELLQIFDTVKEL